MLVSDSASNMKTSQPRNLTIKTPRNVTAQVIKRRWSLKYLLFFVCLFVCFCELTRISGPNQLQECTEFQENSSSLHFNTQNKSTSLVGMLNKKKYHVHIRTQVTCWVRAKESGRGRAQHSYIHVNSKICKKNSTRLRKIYYILL